MGWQQPAAEARPGDGQGDDDPLGSGTDSDPGSRVGGAGTVRCGQQAGVASTALLRRRGAGRRTRYPGSQRERAAERLRSP